MWSVLYFVKGFKRTLEVGGERGAGRVRTKTILGEGGLCCFSAGGHLPGAGCSPGVPRPQVLHPVSMLKLPNVSLRRTQITVGAQNKRYPYQHSCPKRLHIKGLIMHFFFSLTDSLYRRIDNIQLLLSPNMVQQLPGGL